MRHIDTALKTGVELRGPCCQPWPMDVPRLLSPPIARLWQELQLRTPLAESRGANQSTLPSSVFSHVKGLPAAAGTIEGTGSNNSLATARSSSSAACCSPPPVFWVTAANSNTLIRAKAEIPVARSSTFQRRRVTYITREAFPQPNGSLPTHLAAPLRNQLPFPRRVRFT